MHEKSRRQLQGGEIQIGPRVGILSDNDVVYNIFTFHQPNISILFNLKE